MSTLTTYQSGENSETLVLDRVTSIVLPEFDTSAILSSSISEIILSLFVIDYFPAEYKNVHVTVNPFDPLTGKMDDGLSLTIQPIKDHYVDIKLPRELFEKTVRKPKKFLLKLVGDKVKLVFEGIDEYGTTHDPKLIVVYSDKQTQEEIVPVTNFNFFNISMDAHNSNVQIGGQNNNQNFDNRKDSKGWQDILVKLVVGVSIIVLGTLILNYLGIPKRP